MRNTLKIVDKKDNSLDDVINKQLLDGTIDGILDCSKDWLLDGTINGISDGLKDGISDGCFDGTIYGISDSSKDGFLDSTSYRRRFKRCLCCRVTQCLDFKGRDDIFFKIWRNCGGYKN